MKGDIFLNTSLTEAFCMAIVEAGCCGLVLRLVYLPYLPQVLILSIPIYCYIPNDYIDILFQLASGNDTSWRYTGSISTQPCSYG